MCCSSARMNVQPREGMPSPPAVHRYSPCTGKGGDVICSPLPIKAGMFKIGFYACLCDKHMLETGPLSDIFLNLQIDVGKHPTLVLGQHHKQWYNFAVLWSCLQISDYCALSGCTRLPSNFLLSWPRQMDSAQQPLGSGYHKPGGKHI